ncbi:NeuD/PglB/VioB family sugar acetyltransferase [Luminiphilus sp.]|nr:NeuD/PglB/VioB family sugar acetyltransferase [Luminiphilus sp.]
MARLVVVGAGGHSRSVLEVAKSLGFEYIRQVKFPENPSELIPDLASDEVYVIAVADAAVREILAHRLANLGAKAATLISPFALVASDAKIGPGCVVMPGAVIRCGASFGNHTIVNTGASIDHDSSVGEFCHIAPGAVICGGASIQDHVWIGASATVLDSISVVSGAYIGAASLVNRAITVASIFTGIPARRRK